MSYKEATETDFKHSSYLGLRLRYLELLKLPRWKDRLGQLETMDSFGQLESVCKARLGVARSRLQRTQGKQGTQCQGKEEGLPAAKDDNVAANDNITDDNTQKSPVTDGVDESEIDKIGPQQTSQGERKYVHSGRNVGKSKKNTTAHVSERQAPATTKDHKTHRHGMLQEKRSEPATAGNTNPMDEAVPEICETPQPDVASVVKAPEVIVIGSSDDDSSEHDLPLATSRRRVRDKGIATVMISSDEDE